MPVVYFEGVDGVGKTTTMKLVAQVLMGKGIDLVLTKEPGGPQALAQEWRVNGMPYGKKYDGFRSLCVDNPCIPQVVKRALYRADSLYNWELVVRPNLDKLVLCDRSWISDLAYGAVLTEHSMASLFSFNESLAPGQITSAYCIYLHCPPHVREERLKGNMTNHMDKLGPHVRARIENQYQEVLGRYLPRDRQIFVDTSQDLDEVVTEAVEFILDLIKNPCKDFCLQRDSSIA